MKHSNRILFYNMVDQPEAYLLICNGYRQDLARRISKLLNDDWLVAEVVQETLITLWEQRDSVRLLDNPEAWLFTIANHKAVSMYRRVLNSRLMKKKYARLHRNADLHYEIMAKDVERIIRIGIAQLPARQRQIALMMLEHNPPRKEIAALLNISEDTVKNHITCILKFLKEFLQKNGMMGFLCMA